MSEKWFKQVKGTRLARSSSGIVGEEVFARFDASPLAGDAVPTIGVTALVDPVSGGTFTTVVCDTEDVIWSEGDDTAPTKRFTYKTPNEKEWGEDPESRRFCSGIEVVSKQGEGSWYWDGTTVTVLNQDVFKRVFTAEFDIPVKVSDAQKNAYISGTVLPIAGRINTSDFEGFPAGCVLFDGVSAATKYDKDGDLFWLFDLKFQVKFIDGVSEGGVTGKNSWQYLFRGEDGKMWAKPNTKSGGGGDYMYSSVSFSGLDGGGSMVM